MDLDYVNDALLSSLRNQVEHELAELPPENEGPINAEHIAIYINRCLRLLDRTQSIHSINSGSEEAEDRVVITSSDNQEKDRQFEHLLTLLVEQWKWSDAEEKRGRSAPIYLGRLENISGGYLHLHERSIFSYKRYVGYANPLIHRARVLVSSHARIKRLDKAVKKMALAAAMADERLKPDLLYTLLEELLRRLDQVESMNELSRVIVTLFRSSDSTAQENSYDSSILVYIATMFERLFSRTRSAERLDQAIEVATYAACIMALNHPQRRHCFQVLGRSHTMRFDLGESLSDLRNGIKFMTEAVRLTPQKHEDRLVLWREILPRQASYLMVTQRDEDLDGAIETCLEALGDDLEPDFHRQTCLHLTRALRTRYEREGSEDDLNRMSSIVIEAIDMGSQDDLMHAALMSGRASILVCRYGAEASSEDLDEAIELCIKALDIMTVDHFPRPECLRVLGTCLNLRFARTGNMEDLNRAIKFGRDALGPLSKRHPEYVMLAIALGHFLHNRYSYDSAEEDIIDALDVLKAARGVTDKDPLKNYKVLVSLSDAQYKRYSISGEKEALDHAIENYDQAVKVISSTNRFRHDLENSSTFLLLERFRCRGSMDDLRRAVVESETMIKNTSQSHPSRSTYCLALARGLGILHSQTGSPDDKTRSLAAYMDACRCETNSTTARIQIIIECAEANASVQDWQTSNRLMNEVVSLLPLVSLRYLSKSDLQRSIARVSDRGLASIGAAFSRNANEEPHDTLRFLELSRGIMAALVMDMREDLSDLRRDHPGLARKVSNLRLQLDSPMGRSSESLLIDGVMDWDAHLRRRRDAAAEFESLVHRVRSMPGFDDFLQPPTAKDMMAAAKSSPIIVINISRYRCDAFLVQKDHIGAIELKDVTDEMTRRRIAQLEPGSPLGELLEWLWHAICRPCLDALGLSREVTDGEEWPHVWWIPCGLLSRLPLHAAGIFSKPSTETVMHRTISSYASSIKSLLHSRRQRSGVLAEVEPARRKSAVLVSMSHTPGSPSFNNLPHATKEVDMVSELCPALGLSTVMPERRKKEVLQHLQSCEIFHFAGHGQSDMKDPSKSRLLLEDWQHDPITVADFRDTRWRGSAPFLAYLSACSTGSNQAENLSEEGIHLISACQLAGFRHVVGTLWEVSDKHCVEVASVFYRTLQNEGLTNRGVSRGLHFALMASRDKRAKEAQGARDAKLLNLKGHKVQGATDFFWVPYVHYGSLG